jgi:hypothetical protein
VPPPCSGRKKRPRALLSWRSMPPTLYLARRALQSLLEINAPDCERQLLERLAQEPSFLMSDLARAALGR